MNNSFYITLDEKITTWNRHYFRVDNCESEKEAVKKLVKGWNDDDLWTDDISPQGSEQLYECEEQLEPEENGGVATQEITFERNVIWDNVKGFICK